MKELSYDVSEQQKDSVHSCSLFSLALDKSSDICGVVQLSIVIRGSDDNFNILKEIIGLESLLGKTRGSDIYEELKSCLESQQLNLLHSYTSVLYDW